MRLALFGGTFDPIHVGHLRVARAAADAFALDRVHFAPVGHQPLKSASAEASFEDRMAMVALALSQTQSEDGGAIPPDGRFAPSAIDAPRPDGTPNYTVDTLRALAGEYPSAQLFILTGADSFRSLQSWRSPAELLALAEWIVVSRPDYPLTSAYLDRPEFAFTMEQRSRVHVLTTVHEDISATDLRGRLHAAATQHVDPMLLEWLPTSVLAYIRDHRLYR